MKKIKIYNKQVIMVIYSKKKLEKIILEILLFYPMIKIMNEKINLKEIIYNLLI